MLHVFANDARSGSMTIQLKGKPDIYENGQKMGTEKGLKAKFNDGYFRVDDETDEDGAEIVKMLRAQKNFNSPRKARRFFELSEAEIATLDGTTGRKDQVRSEGPRSDQSAEVAALRNDVKELKELLRTSMAQAPASPTKATPMAQAVAAAADKSADGKDAVEEVEEVEEDTPPPAKEKKPRTDYTAYKLSKLQGVAKARKLDTSGNRDDLIARLVNSDPKD